jgi:hypothetical protein
MATEMDYSGENDGFSLGNIEDSWDDADSPTTNIDPKPEDSTKSNADQSRKSQTNQPPKAKTTDSPLGKTPYAFSRQELNNQVKTLRDCGVETQNEIKLPN